MSDSTIPLIPENSKETPGNGLHGTKKMKKLKSRKTLKPEEGVEKKKKETVGEMLSRPKIEMLSSCCRFQSANSKSHIALS